MQSYFYKQLLSVLPCHIRFPLSPRSQLLSDHRSCALLISISCRFHFPRQRQRENERRWVRGGTNTLTHHRGVTSCHHLQPGRTDKKGAFCTLTGTHTSFFSHMHTALARTPTPGECKYKITAGWYFPIIREFLTYRTHSSINQVKTCVGLSALISHVLRHSHDLTAIQMC